MYCIPTRSTIGTVDTIVLRAADDPGGVLLAYVYAIELSERLAHCECPLIV